MNSPWCRIGLLTVFLCALRPAISQENGQTGSASAPNRTPVLVELFTSEGCSSCPPADDFLSRLEHQQPFGSVEIVAMEEHVDYFNHDGWIDPFSSAEWTQRQFSYDAALHAGTPATPQMVVDGQSQFAGGQINDVQNAIREAAQKPRTDVALSWKTSVADGTPQLDVSVGKLVGAGEKDTPEVWLVITESGLHSAVDRGENAGHDLHHASVVRSFQKIGVAKAATDSQSFTGEVAIKLKASWKRENLRAVAIVQEKRSRRILGAAAIPITD